MTRADHDRRRKSRRRIKSRRENPHHEKFHRARVNDQRSHHRQPPWIARGAHQNAVGDAEEDVSGHHRERVPKDGFKGRRVSLFLFHALYYSSFPLSSRARCHFLCIR